MGCRWCRYLGLCALALGAGILIAAIFPVGALLFLVAFLLIGCAAPACADRKEVPMKIVVVKPPRCLSGILRKLFGIKE